MTLQTHGTPDLSYSQSTFRELYEALKEMLNIFDRGFPTEGSIGRTTCDEAIKAIKKAEGK